MHISRRRLRPLSFGKYAELAGKFPSRLREPFFARRFAARAAPDLLVRSPLDMKIQPLTRSGSSVHALIFETGDEVMKSLREFAAREKIRAARFTGIGASPSALLAYFDWETKRYCELPIDEQVEVLHRSFGRLFAPGICPLR
jgi:hypothetical protein